MLITIDPGVHAAGVAWWDGSRLVKACYAKKAAWPELFDGGRDVVFVERQYLTRKHPRPQDIVELAYHAGLIAAYAAGPGGIVNEILPVTWKGNVPKEIQNARTFAKLTEPERTVIQMAGSRSHNVLDAIGIGLYVLKR